MSNFIHFIGKQYYSREQFIKEATSEAQVSRRVAVRTLGSFSWGDRIYLAQGDVRREKLVRPFEGSDVFGFFTVERLSGLSKEAIDLLKEEFETTEISLPIDGQHIVRECGEYDVQFTLAVRADFPEMAKLLWEAYRRGVDIGKPLLAGPFTPLHPTAHLPEYGFRQGYKYFEGFEIAYMYALNQDVSAHSGEVGYMPNEVTVYLPENLHQWLPTNSKDGQLQQVANYSLK